MSIEAMKQALEALDSDNPDIQLRAATALRTAIEQAEIKRLKQRQWIGLTAEEICDIEADELTSASSETFEFARAIEAKLKEKNSE